MPYCDLHNHLLPELDDGARDVDETLRHLAAFRSSGVDAVVFTPHLLVPSLPGDALDAELRRHRARFESVLDAADAEDAPLPDLDLGCEILVRSVAELERVVGRDDVGLAGGDALLIEFGFEPGFDADGILRRMRAEGRTAVIAHPERYDCGGCDPVEAAYRWRERGALLQVNGGSLAGLYRPGANEIACELLAEGLVDLVATDHHGDYRAHDPSMIVAAIDRVGEPGLSDRLYDRGPHRVLRRAREGGHAAAA